MSKRLEQLALLVPDGILRLNDNNKILYANEAAVGYLTADGNTKRVVGRSLPGEPCFDVDGRRLAPATTPSGNQNRRSTATTFCPCVSDQSLGCRHDRVDGLRVPTRHGGSAAG